MFQLVVSVIAIALTSTLALASLHYGGSILSSATIKANATTLINDGQQISNAVVLDSLDNPYQPISADRIPSIPIPPRVAAAGASWQIDSAGIAFIRLADNAADKVCTQIVDMGGSSVASPWNDAASAANALRISNRMFGCMGGAGNAYFAYRLT